MPRKHTVLSKPVGTSRGGTLYIERDTLDELGNFAKAAGQNEICGFLLVRRLGPDVFHVLKDSLHVPLQRVAPGYAEVLPQGEVAQMDLEERLEIDDFEDTFRLLWHSHLGGPAQFSSIDLHAHRVIGSATAFDAMFFMVINWHGQATANLEIYRPFRLGTQVQLVVQENQEEADLTRYKKIVEQVSTVVPDTLFPIDSDFGG